jgi:hypothetical protein
MSGFFTPFPDTEQPVPTGTDSYGVRTPNYREIGQQLGAGIRDAGGTTPHAGWIAKFFSNPISVILTFLAYIIAFLVAKFLCILSFLMRLVTSIDDAAAPGIDAVVQSSLEHVFGIPVAGSTKRKVAAGLSTEATAKALGKQITDALAGGVSASVGGTLKPSTAAADNFLGQMARMGIEGWLDGFIATAVGGERLRSVLELVPIMGEVLGLGRISRQVLMPVLKIQVQEPYTWYLNLKYRPTVLPEGVVVREYLRGKFDPDELDGILGKLGHSSQNIDCLVHDARKRLPVADVNYLVAHGTWGQPRAIEELRGDGWDEQMAGVIANLGEQRRIDAHHQKVIDASLAAFVKGDITRDQLITTVSDFPLPEGELNVFGVTADSLRALNIKHLGLGEVEKLIQAHVMNLDDLQTWMNREGYPEQEQVLLETYLLGKITTADEAAASRKAAADARAKAAAARQQRQAAAAATAAARAEVKGVSMATFEHLVQTGKRTFADFTRYLQDLGLQPAAIQDVVDNLHSVIDAKNLAAQQHAALTAEADTKHIPLSQVEKAVIGGTLTMLDLGNFLTSQEYGAADKELITNYVQAQIAAKQAKAGAKAKSTAAAAEKKISLPELERAARLGLTTVAAYSAALDAAGFDPHSRDLLVGILEDQIAADTVTLAKRKAAAAKAAAGRISLPQIEQAVIAGLRPIADYTAALGALGYDAADQETLTELLQQRVAHAASVAAKEKAAAARLADKDISLADLQRAVKLGVATIDDYTAALADAGFDATDQATMRASLLAQVAAAKQAATKRNKAAKSLGARGISLAQEEQLVKDGILTLDNYGQFLIQNGYSQADADNLAALLKMKIDQAQAAAKLHAAAAAKAADKEISLAAEEKAVIDGDRTMADYQAVLVDLGYDAVDQATLVADLAAKVAAARAKGKGTPPGTAPATPVP